VRRLANVLLAEPVTARATDLGGREESRGSVKPAGRGARRPGEGGGHAAQGSRHDQSRAVQSQRELVLASLLGCTASRAAPAQRRRVVASLLRHPE